MIITIEVEIDDCVKIPTSTAEAADLLYSIDDGQLVGKVTIEKKNWQDPIWRKLR